MIKFLAFFIELMNLSFIKNQIQNKEAQTK